LFPIPRTRVKKKLVLALLIGLGTLGAGTAIHALPHGSQPADQTSSVRQGTPGENQIPAPPHPPRQTPVEHVVVGSK
jgi:hypothetical protein